MALRLLLVAVVAGLALDLPHAPATSAGSRHSWLDARLNSPEAPKILVAEPTPPVASSIALVATEVAPISPPTVALEAIDPIKPVARIGTIRPISTMPTVLPTEVTPAVLTHAKMETLLEEILAVDSLGIPALAREITIESAPLPTLPDLPKSVFAADPVVSIAAALETAEPVKSDDMDAAFARVMKVTVESFAADLASKSTGADSSTTLLAESTTPPPVAMPAEEMAPVATKDMVPNGMAYELNRLAEGLEPIDMADLVIAKGDLDAAKNGPSPEQVATPEEPASDSRAERLTQAVKLTGEAVHAWASLLGQRPSASSTSLQR